MSSPGGGAEVELCIDDRAVSVIAARAERATRIAVDVEANGLFAFRPKLCTMQVAFDEDGEIEFVGAVMDITERRHAEEALRRSQSELALVARLGDGQAASISQLTEGSKLTRQAITKHLRVLERARIVHGVRAGRESLFELDPRPMGEVKEYLDLVSAQWDQALGRLKSFVEGAEK